MKILDAKTIEGGVTPNVSGSTAEHELDLTRVTEMQRLTRDNGDRLPGPTAGQWRTFFSSLVELFTGPDESSPPTTDIASVPQGGDPASKAVLDFARGVVGQRAIQRLDTDQWRGQCVSLVARYIQAVVLSDAERTVPREFGDGLRVAHNLSVNLPQYFSGFHHPSSTSELPVVGAVFSFGRSLGAPLHGHTAVVLEPRLAQRYCLAKDYPRRMREAVAEMQRQVGPLRFDRQGLARRGLLVRHLVMPGLTADSAAIMAWLAAELSPDTWVNLMGQYRPANRVPVERRGAELRYVAIARRPTRRASSSFCLRGRAGISVRSTRASASRGRRSISAVWRSVAGAGRTRR